MKLNSDTRNLFINSLKNCVLQMAHDKMNGRSMIAKKVCENKQIVIDPFEKNTKISFRTF